MKANIKHGIRYTFRVTPGFGGTFYASISKAIPHTYGKRTAYGERTRWKAFSFVEVKNADGGPRFATDSEARQAAVAWIAKKWMSHEIFLATTRAEPARASHP